MKRDANDTHRAEGSEGVRKRHDRAKKHAKGGRGIQRLAESRKSNNNRKNTNRSSTNSGVSGRILPSPALPMQVARLFIEEAFTFENGKTPTLRRWRGGWWIWRQSYWEEADDSAVRAVLYRFTENAIYLDKGSPCAWAPNRKRISDLADALAAICILRSNLDQPSWLDERDSGTIVATANGLLDIERRELHPHSPLFFNQTAVPFDYDKATPPPERWLAFLNKLWPNDSAAIAALGEWYGYVISGRLDLHKIFMTVGPTRGGKGVIARILTAWSENRTRAARPSTASAVISAWHH